jgi:hypothetical protein
MFSITSFLLSSHGQFVQKMSKMKHLNRVLDQRM